MKYCENCLLLTGKNKCPDCGKTELRPPEENDSVYLTTKDNVWAGLVEDVLKSEGIPFLRQGVLGEALSISVGYVLERYRFYVPSGAYARAAELMCGIFPDDGGWTCGGDSTAENDSDDGDFDDND